MTKFESKKVKPDWEAISAWEEDNKALVMWVITTDCIRERMVETGESFKVANDLIYEFCYHSRRGWDMEAFKNAFKDFIIGTTQEQLCDIFITS
jgi:hypothetical protein